jgi:radical SAM-linked protein
MKEIMTLKDGLKSKNFKFGFHSPYSSFIEGIISRGDKRAGDIVEKAFRRGARFDAWDEYHDRSIWKEVINECDWDVEKEICRERGAEESLPWDSISLRVNSSYFKEEKCKSSESVLSAPCEEDCRKPCGVCNKDIHVKNPDEYTFPDLPPVKEVEQTETHDLGEESVKAVFGFSKKDQAIYLGHLDTAHVFERAFQCSGITLSFTQGFNPKPKIEFAHPLSLGVLGRQEIMGVEMPYKPAMENEDLIGKINEFLPTGFSINTVKFYPLQKDKTRKKKTLMGSYAGSEYILTPYTDEQAAILVNDSMLEYFQDKAEELGVKGDYTFKIDEGKFFIQARFHNKKMNNIIKFLREIREAEPMDEWIIERTKLLALNEKGRSADYFNLDSSQS